MPRELAADRVPRGDQVQVHRIGSAAASTAAGSGLGQVGSGIPVPPSTFVMAELPPQAPKEEPKESTPGSSSAPAVASTRDAALSTSAAQIQGGNSDPVVAPTQDAELSSSPTDAEIA